jgi:hypothetical protein
MIVRLPDLVLKTLDAAPTAHNEGIIGSDHRDDIHPLFFELIILLKVRGQVVRVASGLTGRGESRSSRTLGEGLDTRTVNAPGTETITTFFPFHSSVLNVVAVFSSKREHTRV